MTSSGKPSGDEPDLAALMFQILPRLAALEEPVLTASGLSMWEYAILTEVAAGTAASQKELSRRTRRDPTRLGRHLDELAAKELISREKSQDQRQRTIGMTDAGQELLRSVRHQIRAVEDELLQAVLPADDARLFRKLLGQLARGA